MPRATAGKQKGKGKASESKQAVASAPASVFVWAQCDNAGCQKWRKLPPNTVVEEDVPWFCYMNPDPEKDTCSAPEESYNLETEEGHEDISGWGEASSRLAGNASGSTPKSAGLGNHAANAAAPRDRNGKRKAAAHSRGETSPQPARAMAPGQASKRQRTQLRDPQPKKEASPSSPHADAGPSDPAPPTFESRVRVNRYRRGLKAQKAQQGFDKLLAGHGEWEIVKGRGRAITSAPAYIWDALANYAPQAAELAASAVNATSAAKYFDESMDPANDPYMQTANLTCRVALVTAAALASEEASSSTAQEAVLAAAEGTDAHLPRQPHLLDPSTPLTSEMANYIARAGAAGAAGAAHASHGTLLEGGSTPPAAGPASPPHNPAMSIVSHLLAQAAQARYRPPGPPWPRAAPPGQPPSGASTGPGVPPQRPTAQGASPALVQPAPDVRGDPAGVQPGADAAHARHSAAANATQLGVAAYGASAEARRPAGAGDEPVQQQHLHSGSAPAVPASGMLSGAVSSAGRQHQLHGSASAPLHSAAEVVRGDEPPGHRLQVQGSTQSCPMRPAGDAVTVAPQALGPDRLLADSSQQSIPEARLAGEGSAQSIDSDGDSDEGFGGACMAAGRSYAYKGAKSELLQTGLGKDTNEHHKDSALHAAGANGVRNRVPGNGYVLGPHTLPNGSLLGSKGMKELPSGKLGQDAERTQAFNRNSGTVS